MRPVLGANGWLIEMRPLVGAARFPASFRPFVGIERSAAELFTFQVTVVPGLLQTKDYARALIRAGQPGASSQHVDELVEARMARRILLDDEDAPMLRVVLDESVLTRPIGDPQVMSSQLQRLIEANEQEKISIQVLSSDVGAHAGLSGAFVIAVLSAGRDTVFLDNAIEGHVTDHPDDVAVVWQRFNGIRTEALPSRASADLIKRMMQKWESNWS